MKQTKEIKKAVKLLKEVVKGRRGEFKKSLDKVILELMNLDNEKLYENNRSSKMNKLKKIKYINKLMINFEVKESYNGDLEYLKDNKWIKIKYGDKIPKICLKQK